MQRPVTVVTVIMVFLSPSARPYVDSELLQNTYGLQLAPQVSPPRTIDCSSFRKSHIPHIYSLRLSRQFEMNLDWVTLKSRWMTTQENSGYISWIPVSMKIVIHAKTSFTRSGLLKAPYKLSVILRLKLYSSDPSASALTA